MLNKVTLTIFACILTVPVFCAAAGNDEPVVIRVNLNKEVGPMSPVWAWFGHDEPNYTYMKDGRKLIGELAALSPVPVYFRVHNLLCSGDGTAALKWGSTNVYTEDEAGNPVYDWTIMDRIMDTYTERGARPLVQIGFMPEALSTRPTPYRHHWKPGQPYEEIFTGWAYPPKDYDKWAELVFQWVTHSINRYGRGEVEKWYWELWNEPDSGYWRGTMEEYFKLYDYTADAVKRAWPQARIGGPHVTGPAGRRRGEFLTAFLKHCSSGTNYKTGGIGSPLDFIAFHAKGAPRVVDGRVRMDMGRQLRDISRGFEIVSFFEPYRNLPVIIGESDPEGCAACSMQDYPENAYRNGTMYSSYTAASFARKYALADGFDVNFLGAVSWSFEFEDQPWFNGYRDLATNGVNKPVLNVFRMFGMMEGNRVGVSGGTGYDVLKVRDQSVRGEPDINALACKSDAGMTVIVWNYHDDDITDVPAAPVTVHIDGVKGRRVLVHHYRIDQEHSNSYEVWKSMGSPQNPTAEQIEALEKAGQLELLTSPEWANVTDKRLTVDMFLPRQAVSLLKISY